MAPPGRLLVKVRIIAGEFGGRNIDTPPAASTHPMSERVRGALFNILGDLNGKIVLDAFAGSGALGLEAVSRGAARALMIDQNKTAASVSKSNVSLLGVDDRVKVIRAGAASWSANNPSALFDLVLCDPPYARLQVATLEKLARHLKNNGLMVLSHSGREPAPAVNGVVVVDKRNYGDAALAIYRLDRS